MIRFHVISIFPGALGSYLSESIIKRARSRGLIEIKVHNLRDFTRDKHKKVDARPYGGGPGMVMMAEPIIRAVKKIGKGKVFILSPAGKQFDNKIARKLSKYKDIILICGRYEGIDARVKKILKAEKLSVGPYILTGGELPAMVVIDAVSRQILGVLGKSESLEENRVSTSEVYTRPEVLKYKGKPYRVPRVLLSGHHAKINDWKSNRH